MGPWWWRYKLKEVRRANGGGSSISAVRFADGVSSTDNFDGESASDVLMSLMDAFEGEVSGRLK